jgi:NAD(P)-dependent dehydrogenase (short-subunit alcohol dehydrogenase family)
VTSRLLEGRRAIVTAAGHGMGRAIALKMAAEGCRALTLVDRDKGSLDAVTAELADWPVAMFTEVLDLQHSADANRQAVIRAIAAMGGLDVLVSHAGGSIHQSFLETTDEAIEATIQLNFVANFTLAQEAARHMSSAGGGVILITASAVESGGFPEVPVYSAMKAALINLVKAVAPELAACNIRINAVSPGLIDSYGDGAGARSQTVARQLPMGRLGQPEEVAEVFAFLASDRASYITGENVNVHGALTASAHGVKWTDAAWRLDGSVTGKFGDEAPDPTAPGG